MYAKYVKRMLDFTISLLALIMLSPILLILAIVGAIVMKGNPFFTQLRPGRNEKIFKLVKFRTMTCEKDKDGKLLPDEKRLTKYGKLLRSTSLDELPELWNILKVDMSIVGPRPLLVEYLPYYTVEEQCRHDVPPGLTGLAQVNGRNSISWDKKIGYDVQYVSNICFKNDIKIILQTILKVIKRSDIKVGSEFKAGKFIDQRELRTKTTLRKFTAADIPNKVRWINDESNNKYLHYELPLEIEKTQRWFDAIVNRTDRYDAVIEVDGVPVGVIGLLNIDSLNHKAEYYITLGEASYKRKGISYVASKQLLNYGFEVLGVNKIYLNVDANNISACKLYEKIGFTCEGVFKEDMMHRGELIDRKRYALLKREWRCVSK